MSSRPPSSGREGLVKLNMDEKMSIHRIPVTGDEVREFLVDNNECDGPLWTRVRDAGYIMSGRLSAVVPQQVGEVGLRDVKYGGLWKRAGYKRGPDGALIGRKDTWGLDEYVAHMIVDYLRAEPQGICVFEDVTGCASSGGVLEPQPGESGPPTYPILTTDGETDYHMLTHDYAQFDAVEYAIRWSRCAWRHMAYLSTMPESWLSDQRKMTDSLADQLILNLRRILIGAFDGESFVVVDVDRPAPEMG